MANRGLIILVACCFIQFQIKISELLVCVGNQVFNQSGDNFPEDRLPRAPSMLGYFEIYDQDCCWCFCKEQDQKRIRNVFQRIAVCIIREPDSDCITLTEEDLGKCCKTRSSIGPSANSRKRGC